MIIHKVALLIYRRPAAAAVPPTISTCSGRRWKRAGLRLHVPVISLNFSGLESNPGFKLTLPMLVQEGSYRSYLIGDLMMNGRPTRCRPYEVTKVRH